ncbi:MAG TPA: hypothetical protein VFN17_00230 [Nitrosarchaeum sp.]|nr:hypothetical protein [Nitrosarchaeum sp.]
MSSFSSRRGISSVVGALIFTVLMIAGFSAMSLALDSQTDIVNTQRVVADTELKKQQEQFEVVVSADENNILNVSVDNSGQNPVEISRVWIINKTLTTQPAQPFSVNSNDAFIPTGFMTNVLSSQPLYMIPDTYDIKVISALGTVKVTEFTVGTTSSSGLRSEMITDPPDVIIGQNVTVAMIVTNIDSTEIKNVHPDDLDFSATGAGAILNSTTHTPEFVDLKPGESVMFSWDYQVTGNSGDNLTFSSHAIGDGGKTSNGVSDMSTLRLPTDGGTGQVPVDILTDELLARPQLFLTIPGPAGEASSAKSLWGVNVVNPVNSTMKVTKVSVVLMGPGLTGSSSLVNCDGHVSVEGTDNWTCPVNTIMWENVATPIVIPPFSVKSFSVQVTPTLGNSISTMEAMMVQANVFSNSGAFGKSGYQSTMLDGNGAIASVYLSDVVDSVTSSNMKTSRSAIAPGSTQTFNVVFADLDGVDSTYVKSGGQLVINVPKGWTDVTILNNFGFDTGANSPTIIAFGDGSNQITATLPTCTTTCMGSNANPSNTIQFSAKAPTVTTDSMYVMYVLAIGETNSNFTLGPVSEVVLQVDAP